MAEGAEAIRHLRDGDKVLIAESCTHHAVEDDIGRVKIPNWLKKKTGADLQISHVSGCDFPQNLAEYKISYTVRRLHGQPPGNPVPH